MAAIQPILNAYVAFIALVFVGMALIDIAPYLRGRKHRERRRRVFAPRTLVIVPCRGVDLALGENLERIARQDYPNYDAVAVVDKEDDPAADYARKAGLKLLVSGYRKGRSSGKVRAITAALERFGGYDAYAIADSDVTVTREWLRGLVAPLSDSGIGISTSYPRFVPRGGLWSKVKFVWGFVGEGLMENEGTRFGWGGSLAFRKGFADSRLIRMMEGSKYSVSDDICMTKHAKALGLRIAYAKEVQPEVASDDGMREFAEWSTRQTALALLGYRSNLYYGIAFYSAEVLLFISGIAMSLLVSPLSAVLLLHFMKSEAKTYARARTADPAIGAIVLLMPFMYLANLAAASNARYITWRGRRYAVR